jgi:hypothetical protein
MAGTSSTVAPGPGFGGGGTLGVLVALALAVPIKRAATPATAATPKRIFAELLI